MSNTSLGRESRLVYSFVSNFNTVPDEELEQAVTIAVRFTARLIGPRAFQEALEGLHPLTVKALRSWKRWACQSYYWGALWRGVVSGYPKGWGAAPRDVALVQQHLSEEDREQVRQLRSRFRLSRFSSAELQEIYKKLERYCWSLYHRHLRILRFFAVHDPVFHADDIMTDLMEAGMLSIWGCEEKKESITYALNFAKKAAKNHALYLLEKHSFAKRTRFIPDGTGKFVPRLISYDTLFNCAGPQNADNLFSSIRIQLGSQYERYAKAVLGYDPEFDAWVMSCRVRQNPRKQFPNQAHVISKLAQKWVGINTKKESDNLRRELGPLLMERLLNDRGRCEQGVGVS